MWRIISAILATTVLAACSSSGGEDNTTDQAQFFEVDVAPPFFEYLEAFASEGGYEYLLDVSDYQVALVEAASDCLAEAGHYVDMDAVVSGADARREYLIVDGYRSREQVDRLGFGISTGPNIESLFGGEVLALDIVTIRSFGEDGVRCATEAAPSILPNEREAEMFEALNQAAFDVLDRVAADSAVTEASLGWQRCMANAEATEVETEEQLIEVVVGEFDDLIDSGLEAPGGSDEQAESEPDLLPSDELLAQLADFQEYERRIALQSWDCGIDLRTARASAQASAEAQIREQSAGLWIELADFFANG